MDTAGQQVQPSTEPLAAESGRGAVARAAGVIALGNILSRVMGLVRSSAITHYFGTGATVGAFLAAQRVPQMLFDLLVGGLISAALVPVFSEYTGEKERGELWRLASAFLSLATIALAAAVLLVEVAAPWVIAVMAGGFDVGDPQQATEFLRLMAPTLIFMGLSGAVTGLLYALKRFTYPAFATTVFNTGIVLVVLVAHQHLGVTAAAVGVLIGSGLQLLLQLPGLRGTRLRPTLSFSHPALRRILKLYLPVALGVAFGIAYTIVDTRLSLGTGANSLTWMVNATTFVQAALGVTAAALGLAVLPALSRADAERDAVGYQATLGLGLRLTLTLVLPVTVGLAALARPLVSLLYEHGAFTAHDTTMVTAALYLYLVSLPFAAVDQLLIFAFYARKDTLRPNLVQAFSVGIYLLFALPLVGLWGMFGLVLATSALWVWHALLMLLLLRRHIGWPAGQRVGATLLRSLVAAGAMGLAAWGVATLLGRQVGTAGLLPRLAVVGGAVLVGAGVYAGLAVLLRLEEVRVVWEAVRRRVGKGVG